MPTQIPQIMELAVPALPHMERPAYLAAGTAVAAAGIAADVIVSKYNQHREDRSVPIADPEIAEIAQIDGRKTRRLGRLGYYAAVGLAAFAVADQSSPYTTTSKAHGRVTPIILGTYEADAADMKTPGGAPPRSRLEASIDGVLASAKDNNVPYSFILVGDHAQTVDTVPANHKDLKQTRERFNAPLHNSALNSAEFRNADGQLADGVTQALSLGDAGPNKIVLIAANIKPDDAQNLRALKKEIKRYYPEDSLSAIAVGQGEAKYHVATAVQTSATDVQSFEQVLGKGHVQTAASAAEIEQDVNHVADQVQVTEKRQDKHIFETLAWVSAALGAAVAVRRRFSGILKGRR